jgi:chromate transporter
MSEHAPPGAPGPDAHVRQPNAPSVSFAEALRVWTRVALLSFGGPAGQIAVMHRILVDEKRWVSENRFLHALNYCMLLPGPEAQQLATYVGWLLHGWRGGLAAGLLFVLPGFLAILLLSVLYAGFQDLTVVGAVFFGLKPAVMAVVVEAVFRIGRRALRNSTMVALAALSFVAIFFLEVPFPLIVLTAAGIGLVGGRAWPERFLIAVGRAPAAAHGEVVPSVRDDAAAATRPTPGRALRVSTLWLAIWLLPLLALAVALGPAHVFVQEGAFFAQAAVVTFGGAYAVLAYVAQKAVETFGWLRPGEMLDGLGMAETTPGPLIQVVQFVGFMAAFRNPGTLDPMLAGVIGSVVVTWVTFAPCFLWIFLGAPYIEYLRGNKALTCALSAITAAVVGVILNLALWFSLHTLFDEVVEQHHAGLRLLVPNATTLDPAAAVIAVGAFVALFRFKVGMLPTLGGAIVLGAAWHVLTS